MAIKSRASANFVKTGVFLKIDKDSQRCTRLSEAALSARKTSQHLHRSPSCGTSRFQIIAVPEEDAATRDQRAPLSCGDGNDEDEVNGDSILPLATADVAMHKQPRNST